MSAQKINDGVKFQINVKTSQGSLVNLYFYSYDEEEIKGALEVAANITPEINAIETLYNAQGVLKQALGATPVDQSTTVSSEASEIVLDKYENEWTYNLPNAPALPDGRGKYAFKNWVDANGKRRKAWVDPAKGPKPFAKGASEAPLIWLDKK